MRKGVRITFNHKELDFIVHDIQRNIGNERSISLDSAPFLGQNIQDLRISAKTIVVSFSIWNFDKNKNDIKHELAEIFHTTEVKRLEFSDEPDKYYLAIVTGEVEIKETKTLLSEGTITFLIPDGVAHSTAYKRFDSPKSVGDKLVFDLVNNGNVDAYPIITVKHNAENGYLGFVNTSGALELGNREEADTQTVKKSEILFDYVSNNGIIKGLQQGQKNAAILNDLSQNLNGTLALDNTWGRPHIALTNRGSGLRPNNAGSITWEIPLDSNKQSGALHEYIWWRQIFWLGAANQLGFIKVAVSDTEGRFLYGVETIKRSNGLGCEYNFLASDGKGGYRIVNPWTFYGTHRDDQNPFNAERGWSDLLRRDDMVQVFWWGTYPQFRIPEIKGKKSAKIHVAIGTFGNKPQVTHAYLDSIVYRKDFIDTIEDIPNRYQNGSTVVADSEQDRILVDNLDKFSDRVHGSAWLKVPPGKSELEVFCSSWVKAKPTVTVNFEERFL